VRRLGIFLMNRHLSRTDAGFFMCDTGAPFLASQP
jgi:hypothetical protein